MNTHIPEYQNVFKDIDNLITKYENDFSKKFTKMQFTLINELQNNVKSLKAQIEDLRKKTSKEELEQQISNRKQYKENLRIKLEMQWRQITDKLKKMEKQEKQMSNWNKEAEFDIKNLQQKIQQMKTANVALLQKVTELRQKRNSGFFLTDNNSNFPTSTILKNQHRTQNHDKKQQKEIDVDKGKPSDILLELLSRPQIKKKIFYAIYS